MDTVTLLLPEGTRFGGQRLSDTTGRLLGRSDRSHASGGQLARVFDVLPRGWPVAAVTRQRDVGDAAGSTWLRADPVHVRPDINGARLLAHGTALGIDAEDAAAMLPALKPLFGDSGFLLDAPTPTRWYLQLPMGAKLPALASPEAALGADLLDHLPGFDQAETGPASVDARRWRGLLSEAQVTLHNHPRNAERAARGLPAINSLWFWGAGGLPDHVRTHYTQVSSDDDAVSAFANLAGAQPRALPNALDDSEGRGLFDLRHSRDLARLEADWFAPAIAQLMSGSLGQLDFDFADGRQFRMTRGQRWRFWRKSLRNLMVAGVASTES